MEVNEYVKAGTEETAFGQCERQELYEEVNSRVERAFSDTRRFRREARRLYHLYNSWENRKTYPFHNNVDIPIPFKIVETIVPYFSGGDLEPGCVALFPEQAESATRMNSQIKHYNATRAAKKAFADATRWKVLTGVGFIKDGWDFKQDIRRRWVSSDEELVSMAKACGNAELARIASQYMDMNAAAQQGVSPEQAAQSNLQTLEAVKAFLRRHDGNGRFPVRTLEPCGDGFITYDVDQFDAPSLLAVPTYDIAWIGSGDDIQKYEAIYHRYYVSKLQLQRTKRQAEANESSGWINLQYCIESASERNSTSELLSQDFDRDLPRPNSIELIEETRRGEDGMIKVTTICPSASCVVRELDSPFFHNQFNYTRLVTYPDVSDLKGTSIIKAVESLCMAITKQFNSLLDNSDMVQNPAFTVARGSQLLDKQLSLYAGKLIPGRKGEIDPIPIPDVREGTQAIVNYLLSMVFSISGCPEILDSVLPFQGNGTGKVDLDSLKYSSTARIRYQLNADSVSLAGLMERECSNILQFNREPRKIPFMLDGKAEYIDYNPSDGIGPFKFLTDASSMVAPDPSVLRAQLTALLNMAPGLTVAHLDEESQQLVQRQQINVRNVLRLWAETSYVGNPDMFFNDLKQIEAIPAQALPVLPQPEPPPEEQQAMGQQEASQQPREAPQEAQEAPVPEGCVIMPVATLQAILMQGQQAPPQEGQMPVQQDMPPEQPVEDGDIPPEATLDYQMGQMQPPGPDETIMAMGERQLDGFAQHLMSLPPEEILAMMDGLEPEPLLRLFERLSPEVQQWLMGVLPPEKVQFLANPQGNVMTEQGIGISPEMAVQSLQGTGNGGGASGGMNTATGTTGMPPILGGAQQPSGPSPVFSPQQMSMKSDPNEVRKSATTIQQ